MVKPWEEPIADMKCGHARPRLPAEGGWESIGYCFVCPYQGFDSISVPGLEWVHTQWWVFQW